MSRIDAAAPGVATEGERANDLADHLQDTASALETTVADVHLVAGAAYIAAARKVLALDDVVSLRNRTIIGTVWRMADEGIPADPSTVAAFLDRHGIDLPGSQLTPQADLYQAASSAPPPCVLPHLAYDLVIVKVRAGAAESLERLARQWREADIDQLEPVTKPVFVALRADLDRLVRHE